MSLLDNLRPRLRLLRAALTQRYIWTDLTRMVKEHGYELREIRANVHPLQFVRALSPTSAPPPAFPDLGSPQNFVLGDSHAWNSEPTVSSFLREVAFHLQPAHIVELGCFVGWTSAHLAQGLRASASGGLLWCLDSNRKFLDAARANLEAHGLSGQVRFVEGFSTDQAALQTLPTAIDLIFVDTSHDYACTVAEIEIFARRLAPGGLIVLHDSISQNGVRRAILENWNRFDTLTFATEFGNGLTILRARAA